MSNDNIELTPDEQNTVLDLIADWGFEYSLRAERHKVAALARKLGRENLAKDLEK